MERSFPNRRGVAGRAAEASIVHLARVQGHGALPAGVFVPSRHASAVSRFLLQLT
jgi:hypothetical protein